MSLALENKENLKFVHLRSKKNQNHAVTIAYLWNQKTGEVAYTVARCACRDRFCKRTGRKIAGGRFLKRGPSHKLVDIYFPSDLISTFEIIWHPDNSTHIDGKSL